MAKTRGGGQEDEQSEGDSKTQSEHAGRSILQPHALLAIYLTLLGLLCGSCSTLTTNTTSTTGRHVLTPCNSWWTGRRRRIWRSAWLVDGSGSFMGDHTASHAFVAQQVGLIVDGAVDKGAALRVIVFGGSAGNARTVVECPVMAVHYRNEAARAAKLAYLKQVARDQVWLAVRNGRPPMARPGTSVVGGYVALADATPLTGGGGRH